MVIPAMQPTVAALMARGKGILAADESLPTIRKRFEAQGIPSTEENRRAYRELLFTTPALGEFISGAILFDETIRQRTADGVPMAEVLAKQGIIPGIKVDRGTIGLAHFPGERITEGLDGLRERLIEYREMGALFTKWRAVIGIGGASPSRICIEDNARTLALFAAISQEAGLVPIVEPEVLMDGDHTIDRCEEVTNSVLQTLFCALFDHRVRLEQMILKTGMVLSGADCPEQADADVVAERTLRSLLRTVPAALPGIVFLSGGQSPETATRNLNAICRLGRERWMLSFSFGRALQAPVLEIWKGSQENVPAAQTALDVRARCNSFAVQRQHWSAAQNASAGEGCQS